jgi:hypothetical protein
MKLFVPILQFDFIGYPISVGENEYHSQKSDAQKFHFVRELKKMRNDKEKVLTGGLFYLKYLGITLSMM